MATSGTAFTYGAATTFRLNSLFSPVTSGHQPYGFDQLAALYERYKVHAVDFEMTVMYNGGVQNNFLSGVIVTPGSGSTIAGSTVDIVVEKPMSFTVPIVGGTNAGCAYVKQRFDVARMMGLTRKEYTANVEDYQALVSASPSRLLSLEVAVADTQTTTATSNKVLVNFVFHAEFWSRVVLGQS
jgi:hypothetical protein